MFNNQQDDQTQQSNTSMDQVAQEISDQPAPSLGLGVNPTSFTPTEHPEASQTPPVPDPAPVADDSSSSYTTPVPDPVISTTHAAVSGPATDTELEEIKLHALQQLSPLVNKLDQPAEEKYKTLMMLIQASDNKDLLKEAYDAANAITDEKQKAEALLGIVNEINYFSQKPAS